MEKTDQRIVWEQVTTNGVTKHVPTCKKCGATLIEKDNKVMPCTRCKS